VEAFELAAVAEEVLYEAAGLAVVVAGARCEEVV
jgi:hypothetical protein